MILLSVVVVFPALHNQQRHYYKNVRNQGCLFKTLHTLELV